MHIELGRQFNEGKILNAKKVASFISRYGRRFMAPPGSIILIAVAIAIFAAISSIGFAASAWRFLQRTSLALPVRLIATAMVVGLLATHRAFMIASHERLQIVLLSLAVVASVLAWITWLIFWRAGPPGKQLHPPRPSRRSN